MKRHRFTFVVQKVTGSYEYIVLLWKELSEERHDLYFALTGLTLRTVTDTTVKLFTVEYIWIFIFHSVTAVSSWF